MRLIKLTGIDSGGPSYINVENITAITDWENGSKVYFKGGTLEAQESAEEIAKSCAPTKRMGEGNITVYHG
jgi:hypothetical protein